MIVVYADGRKGLLMMVMLHATLFFIIPFDAISEKKGASCAVAGAGVENILVTRIIDDSLDS
jgi:hypothetical protein